MFTARYGLSPYIKHITEVESVYCAVRTESLYKTDTFHPQRVNDVINYYFRGFRKMFSPFETKKLTSSTRSGG